jgi:hypothetical protein
MLSCSFTKEVWLEIERVIGLKNAWRGTTIEEALRGWCLNNETLRYRALPLTIAWGIWLAINTKLFEDKGVIPLQCVLQSLNILSAFPQQKYPHTPKHIPKNL